MLPCGVVHRTRAAYSIRKHPCIHLLSCHPAYQFVQSIGVLTGRHRPMFEWYGLLSRSLGLIIAFSHQHNVRDLEEPTTRLPSTNGC